MPLQITHIAGKKVVEQDVAMGVHPRWRDQTVPYRGVVYVLLEDGTAGFACETCGYMHEKIASVASHRNSHNDAIKQPDYPLETIKSLLRAVKRAKQAGHRNYCEMAASELNSRRIKTMDETPWRADQVSRLFKHWVDRIPAAIPPARPQQVTAPDLKTKDIVPAQRTNGRRLPAVQENPVVTEQVDSPLVSQLIAMGDKLHEMSTEFERLASDVAAELAKGKVDPEVLEKAANWDRIGRETVEKARKFDAAQSLFGNGK